MQSYHLYPVDRFSEEIVITYYSAISARVEREKQFTMYDTRNSTIRYLEDGILTEIIVVI